VEDVRYSRGMGFSKKNNSKLESEGHMCSENFPFSREVYEYEEKNIFYWRDFGDDNACSWKD
jgi:hypothetical protein